MIPILDTHLHLLYQQNFSYDWCADCPPLQQDFTIEDYQKITQDLGISASIFMEVDVVESEIAKEAAFITELVKKTENPLIGVIAACRPEHQNFQELLESTLTDSICGLRRVLHVMPDDTSKSSLFRNNIKTLTNHKLPFDLCIGENQLDTGYDLIVACPDNQFVLDHCGNPTLTKEHFANWQKSMKRIAELPNVVCKISGIIAGLPQDSPITSLNPWINETLECFGSDKVMIGSDWPVCNLGRDLPTWINTVRTHFETFSENEQHNIFHENAERIYGLSFR